MIIVFGGIKGGTGKTTLATNLVVLRAENHKVLLIDADEQQSASDWAEIRTDNILPQFTTVSLFGKNIHSQISRLYCDFDDIIIDVGGRDTTSQRSALTIADILIIPFKPRSLDIWTIAKVKSLISEIEIVNPNLKSIFVINQADPRGSDNAEALKILKEANYTCASHFIGNRKCFANAASQGLGISELNTKDKNAINEMEKLKDLIFSI